MPVKKYHLSDIKIFGVVEGVAIEALDKYPLSIVPEGEGIVGGDYCEPLLFGMECGQFDFVGVCIVTYI